MIDTSQQVPQPPAQGLDPQRPAPVQHTQDSFNNTLDQNPGLTQEIQQALAETGKKVDPQVPPTKSGSTLSSIWDTIKGSIQGAKRGVAEGLNNASNSVMDLGKQAGKLVAGTSLDLKGGMTDASRAQSKQDFAKWYEGKTSSQNPVQIPEDKITRWFGPSQGGVPGFVEGATQFVTGLVLTRKIAVPGGPAVSAALKGAVADIAAFDPYQKRLSNMIQDGPSWMKNPLTEFLQSKDNDPMPLARFKQAAEGVLLNSTIEAITHGVKALKASVQGDTKAAAESVTAAADVKPDPTDVVKVEPTENGQWAVLPVEKSEVDPHFTFTRGEAETKAASINYVAANGRYVPGELDPESITNFQKRMKAYTDGNDPRSIEDLRDQYGINLNYVQSPEEVTNTIKAMVDVMPDPSAMTRNRPRSFQEIRAAATDMFKDMPADEVLANAQRVFGDTERLPEQITAMREWMYEQANQTRKLSQMADADPTNAVVHEQLGKALDTMMDFHAHLTGTSSNVGRALAAHQLPVGNAATELADAAGGAGAKETPEGLAADAQGVGGTVEGEAEDPTPHRAPQIPKATAGLTQAQIRALARTIFLTDSNDPAAILQAVRGPKVTAKAVQTLDPSTLQKYASFAQTWRMEAMLSGPKTQLTKVASDMFTMLQRPAEYWWAGARTDNPALKDMGTSMYGAIFPSLKDSFAAAKKAFMSGDNVLLPSQSHTGATLGPLDQSGWLTNLLHLPSRMLMTTDEFAKQMNYRMNMRAQILRKADAAGITDPQELGRRVTDDMQFAFDPDGGAVNPMALQYAKEGTFTNDLGNHPMQQDILNFVNKHPTAKVIVPFVRTPMNIFNFAWERTPLLNKLNKDMQDAWSGKLGPDAKALAQAKTEAGMALWSTAALLTYTGNITGRGPSDVNLRKQWVAAGNQPYSFKVPGTEQWMSYRRINPQLDAFGLVADMVQMSGDVKSDDWSDVASAVLSSFASNVTSKTFMQGVSDFTDAIGSGDPNKMNKFMKSMAGSFVPNALNQFNPDQTLRESRNVVDEMASRVPGFSDDLEPRRNLMGEPMMKPPGYFNDAVNPFTIAPGAKAGDVQDELVKLGKAFSMPSTHRVGSLIDLTDRQTFNDGPKSGQSPYDRMLELMSDDNAGGSLRDQLTRMVGSDAYQNAPAEDAYGPGGLRWKLANDIIQSKQQASWGQVLQEYPKLQQAYTQAMDMQAQGTARGKQGVNDVLQKYTDLFLTKKK